MARNQSPSPPRRIVVIDDDPAVRASLRMMLEYEGYQIVAATTGREGLALVECALPDLVLLDVEMPGIDGLEVLRRLHTAHESLPVVMISGHRTAAITLEARRCGAVDFLEKPFKSTDDLLTAINKAIARFRPCEERPNDKDVTSRQISHDSDHSQQS